MKTAQETRLALLEQSINHTTDILNKIDKNINKQDARTDKFEQKMEEGFDKIVNKFDLIDIKMVTIEQRLWTNFYWILGAMFTLSCVGGSILAKGFKWF